MDSVKAQEESQASTDDLQDDFPNAIWTSLPPEVFTILYGFFGPIGPEHVLDQDDHNQLISELRLVCKTWRDLIDDNINFVDVLVNDVTLSGSGLEHLRIKSCRVEDLTIELPPNQLLSREPNLLTEVSLNGIITTKNLTWFSNQTPNLKTLQLKYQFFRNSDDEIFLTTSPNEEPSIHLFWNRIENLDLECGAIRVSTTSDMEKLTSILSSTMPNLKEFSLRIVWNAATYRLLISFLLRHPKLLRVHIACRGEGSRLYSFGNMVLFEEIELEKIQLKTLTVETGRSEIGREFLIELVKLQKSIVSLTLDDWTPSGSLFINALKDIIKKNLKTLTNLSIAARHFDGTLNARMFQKMTALKSLNIWTRDEQSRPGNLPFPKILNLVFLPGSLESFELDRFECQKVDVFQMSTAHHLDNIRTLKLFGVGDSVITSELLEVLLKKEKLRGLKLCPLDLKLFRTEDSGHRKYVKNIISKDGHKVPVKVWGVDEALGFHLKVNCKLLKNTSNIKYTAI